MPKFCKLTYGRLQGIYDLKKKKYHKSKDKHSKYIGTSGLIVIFESENTYPGEKIIYFFPWEHTSLLQYRFSTDHGVIFENNNTITWIGLDKKFVFELGDFDLTENDKEELLLDCRMAFLWCLGEINASLGITDAGTEETTKSN